MRIEAIVVSACRSGYKEIPFSRSNAMHRKNSWWPGWALVLLAGLLIQSALASQPKSIVDTAFVQEAARRGVILWDVRGWPAYRQFS